MADPNTAQPLGAQLPPGYTPPTLPQEVIPQTEIPESTAPAVPVQVDRSVFLAARLRELLAVESNLRSLVADLQKENARLRAVQAQSEIAGLDSDFQITEGTILQKRPDGTYWRIPPEAVKQG